MVGAVQFTVGFAAFVADRFLGAGGGAAAVAAAIAANGAVPRAAHMPAHIATFGAFAVYPIVRHHKGFKLMTAGPVF